MPTAAQAVFIAMQKVAMVFETQQPWTGAQE